MKNRNFEDRNQAIKLKSPLNALNTYYYYTMKTLSFLLLLLLAFDFSFAQRTPAVNAVQLADSIVFAGSVSISHATITFHPVLRKYYTVRIGNASFPLQTFSETLVPLFQDTAGMDSRGIWFNPNTNQVERNCFGSLGWSTIHLDGSGNATKNFTVLFAGQNQPTVQSVGAYDYKTNTVLFNQSGVVKVYSRNTAALIQTLTLTGTSLTNVNTESIIYTGETGFEIGLLDYVAKRVLLFDRATGAFTGATQLPAAALTHNQFRFCYANFRVWLFNSSLKKWNSYNIWNQAVPLPVTLTGFKAEAVSGQSVHCKWSTASEKNNDFFTIERSRDGKEFTEAGRVAGAGNSSTVQTYFFTDNSPLSGTSYYRLKQTDFDGQFTYSNVEMVKQSIGSSDFTIYPNPATDRVSVQATLIGNDPYRLNLINAEGKVLFSQEGIADGDLLQLNTGTFQRGIYFIELSGEGNPVRQKLVLN